MKAAILMTTASFIFAVAYAVIKQISHELGFWEAAFFRSFIGFIVLSVFLLKQNYPIIGKKENYKHLFYRGFFGGIAMVFYFWGIQLAPLANASALHHTHPLFTTILGILILKEQFSKTKLILVFTAALGVFIILHPEASVFQITSVPALISGFLASLAYLTVRVLSSKEKPAAIINSLSIITSIITLPATIYYWKTPNLRQWGLLLTAGLLATLAQVFMTLAYKADEASNVAAFAFSSILWSILAGIIFFGEIPSIVELIGIITIFTSMVLLVLIRSKKKSSKQNKILSET